MGHELDSNIETAWKGVDDAEVVDERKVDRVVGELDRKIEILLPFKRQSGLGVGWGEQWCWLREDLFLMMRW